MRVIFRFILKLLGWVLLVPIYFYRGAISPLLPNSCRHVPTCSRYAIEAIKVHGPFIGFYLGAKRILHCHPWGTHGYDPVPPRGQFRVKRLNLKSKPGADHSTNQCR